MRTDFITQIEADELIYSLPQEYRVICRCAAESGFRIGDICGARWTDYDEQERTLTLIEDKTNKTRTAAVNERLKLELALQRYRVPEYEVYIFPGAEQGTHVSRSTVWRWVKRAWKWLHKDDGRTISPHSFRKLYAVNQRQAGKKLADIKRDLNHDRLSTTMIYAFADQIDEAENNEEFEISVPSVPN